MSIDQRSTIRNHLAAAMNAVAIDSRAPLEKTIQQLTMERDEATKVAEHRSLEAIQCRKRMEELEAELASLKEPEKTPSILEAVPAMLAQDMGQAPPTNHVEQDHDISESEESEMDSCATESEDSGLDESEEPADPLAALSILAKTSALASTSVATKTKTKRPRGAPCGPRPIPAPEDRCMARTAEGDGSCQCKNGRKVGDYCVRHAKQAAANPKPLMFTPDGKRDGLFYGRIDEERPQVNENGEVCELWGEKMSSFPATTKWHTSTPMFKAAQRKNAKKAAKQQESTSDAAVDTKVTTKSKTPYARFLAINSVHIKAGLLRTSANGKLARGELQKAAGQIWTAMSVEQKQTFA